MSVWKIVISDPETRKAYQLEVDQNNAPQLIGKKIGDEFPGDWIGLEGYTLLITGGTDKDGFPMHPAIHGAVKKKVLLSAPPGFHPKKEGQRKKKTVRGNTISADIVQINVKVIKKGSKPLEEIFKKEEQSEQQQQQ